MILFGASGHSKVVLDILISKQAKVEFIVDDNPNVLEMFGVKVYNTNNIDLEKDAIIAIGDNKTRKKVSEKYSFKYATAIHQRATVSQFAFIDEGSVVMANSAINPDVKIGKHCIINTGAVIEHDCEIGNFVHVSPNASLSGNVVVGEGVHVGVGASVIQGIKIGKWSIIGAGSVIIKDVPDYATSV